MRSLPLNLDYYLNRAWTRTPPLPTRQAALNTIRCISNGAMLTPDRFHVGPQGVESNGLFRSFLPFLFENNPGELKREIDRSIQVLSRCERSAFIHATSHEMTELFLVAQKYNQAVLNAAPLFQELQLGPLQNRDVCEMNPLEVVLESAAPFDPQIHRDYPPHKHPTGDHSFVYRYDEADARISHEKEALRIFLSTQRERLLSGIGKVVETIARIFGWEITCFQKYHYFRENETEDLIYSQDAPLSQTLEPSSYWLGHASCLIKVPLSARASVHIITDPIEGDLQGLFYPRQTKVARKIEDCPVPHVFLLSHNHLDHYSQETIQKLLAYQPLMIVPEGDKEKLVAMGFKKVEQLNWWERATIRVRQNQEQHTLQITAVPAHHWTGQGPCAGGDESSFLGYVIGASRGDIYFAGDTAKLSPSHIDILREHFNIRYSFQPGGPDEMREDMQSTHQASVDGLWMHFNLMVKKVYAESRGSRQQFLENCRRLKTVYMHTKTYKLGNLHFDDTQSSIERVKAALRQADEASFQKMTSYEQGVYEELLGLAGEFVFDGMPLSAQEIADLLDETVIVPKIGSRTPLNLSQ